MSPHRTPVSLMVLLAAWAQACGGASGNAGGPTRAPTKAGDVWIIANPDDPASAPAAVLAYVNGLHSFVLDGNAAYLGMTRLAARKGENGARVIAVPGAGEVQIRAAGDSLELRFPGGETVPLQKQRSFNK
jgi:hypothetical protein